MKAKLWNEFWQSYYPVLLSHLKGRGASHEDAEDAVMEAVARLMRSRMAEDLEILIVRDPRRVRTWLFTTARHYLLSQARRQQIAPMTSLDALPPQAQPTEEAGMEAVLVRMAIAQAWQQLSASERHSLRLNGAGYSSSDITQKCGVNTESQKKRLQRARHAFAQALCKFGMDTLFGIPHTRSHSRHLFNVANLRPANTLH